MRGDDQEKQPYCSFRSRCPQASLTVLCTRRGQRSIPLKQLRRWTVALVALSYGYLTALVGCTVSLLERAGSTSLTTHKPGVMEYRGARLSVGAFSENTQALGALCKLCSTIPTFLAICAAEDGIRHKAFRLRLQRPWVRKICISVPIARDLPNTGRAHETSCRMHKQRRLSTCMSEASAA